MTSRTRSPSCVPPLDDAVAELLAVVLGVEGGPQLVRDRPSLSATVSFLRESVVPVFGIGERESSVLASEPRSEQAESLHSLGRRRRAVVRLGTRLRSTAPSGSKSRRAERQTALASVAASAEHEGAFDG